MSPEDTRLKQILAQLVKNQLDLETPKWMGFGNGMIFASLTASKVTMSVYVKTKGMDCFLDHTPNRIPPCGLRLRKFPTISDWMSKAHRMICILELKCLFLSFRCSGVCQPLYHVCRCWALTLSRCRLDSTARPKVALLLLSISRSFGVLSFCVSFCHNAWRQ